MDGQDPVAVFLAQVFDVGVGGFEDAQPQQAEERHQGEVAGLGRGAGSGQQGFELQVGQPQGRDSTETRGRRTWWPVRPAARRR